MRRSFRFVMAGLALAAAAPALAQDEWADQVQSLIRTAADTFAEAGYDYGTFSLAGALDDGDRVRVGFRVSADVDTKLVGVCDTDCSDIDLVLYDQNGKEVARDVLDDDVPIVDVHSSRGGLYTVEITMADCETAPCRYGVQQFVK